MLNWAIIGCGTIAPLHAGAVKHSTGARLYAVCDIEAETANKFAAEHDAEKVYTDYRELLSDPLVDVVSICTPSGMHAEMAIEAARQKKHILVEKPMDVTKEKIDRMAAAAHENEIKMGCVYQLRTGPGAQAAKQYIETHDLGKLIYGIAQAQYYRSPEYYKSAGWRATWELDGGGCLMNQGIHTVDLLRWMLGEVKTVTAKCATVVHAIPVEDTAMAIVEFQSGAMGMIQGSTHTVPGKASVVYLYFEKGTLWFNDKEMGGKIGTSGEEIPGVSIESDEVGNDHKAIWSQSHFVMVQDLIDAIREDREPMIPPEEGRKSVDLILAIYESSKENRTIVME